MDAQTIFRTFNEHGVEYLVVGLSAAWMHGVDEKLGCIDICYHQQWHNCECLNRALDELDARLVPPPPTPMPLTSLLRRQQEEAVLQSPAGHVSLVAELRGMGTYEDLSPDAVTLRHEGERVPTLSIDQLDNWLRLACKTGDTGPLHILLSLERLQWTT